MFFRIIILLFIFGISVGEVHSQGKSIKHDSIPTRRKVVKQSVNDASAGPAKRVRSKIVNDSAKAVYGPKTTLSTTEKEIFLGRKSYEQLDTAIINLHRWDFVRKFENKYQDLGNNGTALNPIFPIVSGNIGATPGYKVYDVYYETAEPRIYNTKSPFTRINVIWGGKGRSITHVEFTRNINPRWNFGFNYRPVLSANQIPFGGNKNYQLISHYYDFNTSFQSKNKRYKALLSYRRIRHHVKENGGVKLAANSEYKAYFDANAIAYFTISLNTPVLITTDELRNNIHLFHQFQLAKPAQFYHVFDWGRQINTFNNTNSADPQSTAYFKYATSNTTVVNDVNNFQTIQNEFGLKGNAAFLFYDFYFKLRSYTNTMSNLQGQAPNAKGVESYIGSRISFRFDSLSQLSGQAEYLLDGHYKIEGSLRTPWLDAELRSALAKPGFMQQVYRGGYNTWNYGFTNTFSNQISGRIKAQLGPLFVSPGLTYTALKDYIYFKSDTLQQALPHQSSGNQQIVSPELRMDIRLLKKIHLRPEVTYTLLLNNDDNAVSIPAWFTNVQLSYENFIFKGALQIQAGVEMHNKSNYKALGYA
ncbi:MAG TPA: putative porin, partial [Cyclobacteriaceae bacterium]|nr:putative porin [Cyclobacteriaceae bacterium]